MMNATWDILDASGKTIATGYQQVKDLGGMAIGVVKDWFSSNWVVLDLAGHQVGGNYNAVSVQGGHVVVSTIGQIGWTQLDIPTVSPPAPPETLPVAAAPPPSQSAHAITPPVLQKLQVTTAAPATAPETGGISFAGAQNYKEASGVAAQADRASGEAERIPPRKK